MRISHKYERMKNFKLCSIAERVRSINKTSS